MTEFSYDNIEKSIDVLHLNLSSSIRLINGMAHRICHDITIHNNPSF